MRRTIFRTPSVTGSALSLLLLCGFAMDGSAQVVPDRNLQTGMRTGIGYNGAVPDAAAGAGVWHFLGESRFGAFVDGKMSTSNIADDDTYCPAALSQCTVSYVTETRTNFDFLLRDHDEWLAFNAGGMYAVTPEFALMLGAGLVRQTRFREFVTDEEELWITSTGTFIVDRAPDEDWGAQAVVGGLLRMGSSLAGSFAYETRNRGISVGLYWVLP